MKVKAITKWQIHIHAPTLHQYDKNVFKKGLECRVMMYLLPGRYGTLYQNSYFPMSPWLVVDIKYILS